MMERPYLGKLTRLVKQKMHDTSAVRVDSIPTAWLAEVRLDDAFDYSTRRPPTNIWKEFLRYFEQLIAEVAGDRNVSWILDALLWAMFLVAIGLIVWMVRRSRAVLPVASGGGRVRRDTVSVEDIASMDFDRIIGEEVEAGRYRSAIRYQYLRALADLQERKHILYKPDRTNRAYARELASTPFAAPFASCVRVYERVWYGNLPATSELYDEQREIFDELRGIVGRGAA